jgi:hypothetical protein
VPAGEDIEGFYLGCEHSGRLTAREQEGRKLVNSLPHGSQLLIIGVTTAKWVRNPLAGSIWFKYGNVGAAELCSLS